MVWHVFIGRRRDEDSQQLVLDVLTFRGGLTVSQLPVKQFIMQVRSLPSELAVVGQLVVHHPSKVK